MSRVNVVVGWLGHAINTTTGERGHLVCGPIDREYRIQWECGGLVAHQSSEVHIQLGPRSGFVVFHGEQS